MWTYNDNYLMHYGVKGMKWGVRHDPIRSGVHRFRTDRGESSSGKGLSDRQKTALKVAGGAALVVGGTIMAHKLNKKLVATGGRSVKALANKQAMKTASSSIPDHTQVYRRYGISYSKHLKNSTPGRKMKSTRGRLTGHSQLENKASASLHRANFYEDRYRRRMNKVIDYQNRIGRPVFDSKKSFYRDEYVNALDQLRRSSGDPLRTSGNLGVMYRYRRK